MVLWLNSKESEQNLCTKLRSRKIQSTMSCQRQSHALKLGKCHRCSFQNNHLNSALYQFSQILFRLTLKAILFSSVLSLRLLIGTFCSQLIVLRKAKSSIPQIPLRAVMAICLSSFKKPHLAATWTIQSVRYFTHQEHSMRNTLTESCLGICTARSCWLILQLLRE